MMKSQQIDFLSKVGRHAFVLIYLVVQSRPVTVSELARDLDINRETALAHLRKLAEFQAATRTRYGWLPTVAGRQLILPEPVKEIEAPVDKVTGAQGHPPEVAEIPSLLTENPSPLINNKESLINIEVKESYLLISDLAEKPPPLADNPTWEALKKANIRRNKRTEDIYAAEHLTPQHVVAAEGYLRKRYGGRYTTGLLISTLETVQPGDKPIGHQVGCGCSACNSADGNRYSAWEDG